MKRFLGKSLLLALLVCGLLYLGGLAYQGTETYQNLERAEQTDVFHDVPEGVEIAVFGLSHGKEDFLYFPEGVRGFNFAMSSQTPQYDWMMMHQHGDRFAPEAVVLLTVAYTSRFVLDTKEEFERKQGRYYRILDPWNIVNVELPRWGLERLSPLLTTTPEKVLSAFLQPEESIAEALAQRQLRTVSLEEIPAERERVGRSHWQYVASNFPNGSPVMLDAYDQMLKRCRERGWNAVLVTPPYLEAYSQCFPEGFYEEFC